MRSNRHPSRAHTTDKGEAAAKTRRRQAHHMLLSVVDLADRVGLAPGIGNLPVCVAVLVLAYQGLALHGVQEGPHAPTAGGTRSQQPHRRPGPVLRSMRPHTRGLRQECSDCPPPPHSACHISRGFQSIRPAPNARRTPSTPKIATTAASAAHPLVHKMPLRSSSKRPPTCPDPLSVPSSDSRNKKKLINGAPLPMPDLALQPHARARKLQPHW